MNVEYKTNSVAKLKKLITAAEDKDEDMTRIVAECRKFLADPRLSKWHRANLLLLIAHSTEGE